MCTLTKQAGLHYTLGQVKLTSVNTKEAQHFMLGLNDPSLFPTITLMYFPAILELGNVALPTPNLYGVSTMGSVAVLTQFNAAQFQGNDWWHQVGMCSKP